MMQVDVASADGGFRFAMLAPGMYAVTAEELGFQPRTVLDVPVRRARDVDLTIELPFADPPVMTIDTVRFAASALELDPLSRAFGRLELEQVPDGRRNLGELGEQMALGGDALEIDGLPAASSGAVSDGLRTSGARHPWLVDRTQLSAFVPSALVRSTLVSDETDVEWSGYAGGWFLADTRRAPQRLEVSLFGDWTGDALVSSDRFGGDLISFGSVRGGLRVGGPIIADTAFFVIGAEVNRVRSPLPRAWVPRPVDVALAASTDSLGVDLAPFLRPRVTETDAATVYARFDWRLAEGQQLSVRGQFASVTGDGVDVGPDGTWTPGTTLDGSDLAATASLTSYWGGALANEARVGFEFGKREYTADAIPSTRIVDEAIAFGSDARLPARFERSTVRARETLHFSSGTHQIKLGLDGEFNSWDQTFAFGSAGEFAFSRAVDLDVRSGVFTQAVGSLPVSSFSTQLVGVFLQDRWSLAPDLDFQIGLRYESEFLPQTRIPANTEFLARSGLANDSLTRTRGKFSPRASLTWDIGNRGEWIVIARTGVFYDLADPGLLGELVSHAGRVEVRRGVGNLTSWPDAPPVSAASVTGQRLVLFAPNYEPPRSSRASFGITRTLGHNSALHLSTAFRHTDFLPRRQDLNILPSVTATDQNGRPIYGELQQLGGILAATPGSNRRFAGFDLISAINTDGESEYWDVRLALESRMGRVLELYADYRYSQTSDNWLSGRRGGLEGQLTPFPDSLAGLDWADGRSDFDIPHRLSVAAVLRVLGHEGLSIAALYRYRSGYPFTPGYRDGVDANGDGSARNDPAFVDDGITGVDDLVVAWPCLQTQTGQFAERNSCRGPAVDRLNLRLEIGPFSLGGYPVSLQIDALNVMDEDSPVIDRALYLVDPTQTLTTDAAAGTVTVPLIANPGFGQPTAFRTSGRAFRFGLRVNY